MAVRHPGRVSSRLAAGKAGQVSAIYADVWDEPSVGPALEGSNAVINTVGHYVERGKATFEAIHGHGAMHVARAAALAGVERLVHISGIGADAASASTYVRARAIGERLVREQFSEATILRPSVLFGPDDAFLNRLAAMARVMPVLPLFGSGQTRLQQVYVGDVAEAVVNSALRREESRGAHQRTDFPKRDDERFLAHSLTYRNADGSSRVEYLPVKITRWPPAERVYGEAAPHGGPHHVAGSPVSSGTAV